MPEKISTLILKVDLECCRCSKKIRKILCILQEKVHITYISYDETNGTVTVSGVFDPDRLSKKPRSRAGKVIKKIEEKPEEKKEEKQEENKEEKKEEEKKEEEKKEAPEPGIKFDPVIVGPYFWPAGVAICCPRPYLESYHGGCRCCACGKLQTENQPAPDPTPPPCYPPAAPYYYPAPYKTCQLVCEEEPSAICSIM